MTDREKKARIKRVRQIVISMVEDIEDLDLLERIADFIDEQTYIPDEDDD